MLPRAVFASLLVSPRSAGPKAQAGPLDNRAKSAQARDGAMVNPGDPGHEASRSSPTPAADGAHDARDKDLA
jgi:hypothetical protein